eukprot:TRINITY_DN27143_c0_g1_i1.p1 TRINITY_DN27143_c0_g1~~TRINITY_DN27143_c0_g1_i1.p1  ORF type:complete len:586 (+),score=156.50 TRINITY_DN27143_c0_g1_i1:171-1760(+)
MAIISREVGLRAVLAIPILSGLFGAVCILARMELTTPIVLIHCYATGIAILLGDLLRRTIGSQMWAVFVLVVDLLLVMRVPRVYSKIPVIVATIWIMLVAVEQTVRFGLFDLPGTYPQSFRREQLSTDCDVLPCPERFDVAIEGAVGSLLMFAVDFIATRGFADEVLQEQESMQNTIAIVEEIATRLGAYDIDTVATLLEWKQEDLPEAMYAALQRLEHNLRVYKPYLPATCLQYEYRATAQEEKTSVAESCSSSVVSIKSPAAMVYPFMEMRSTLVVVNLQRSADLVADAINFSMTFTQMMDSVVANVTNMKGMVDVFVGNTVHCSFNASQRCVTHPSSAVTAMKRVMWDLGNTFPVNVGIATGAVFRGDMGCVTMRRFNILGRLIFDVAGVERAGRVLGSRALCTYTSFTEVESEHSVRLVPRMMDFRRGSGLTRVAEVDVETAPSAHGGNCEPEWMYALEASGREWRQYNIAVNKLLSGASVEEAVRLAEGKGPALEEAIAAVRGGTFKGSAPLVVESGGQWAWSG